MERCILLLFDSLTVRNEAVQYSIELAKRTDSGLVFLMLLPPETGERASAGSDRSQDLEEGIHDILMKCLEDAEKAGLFVDAVVRMGDPQSELMKFLASSRSIQTIVWGGRPDVINKGAHQKNAHWLVKIKGMAEYPVVVPSKKS